MSATKDIRVVTVLLLLSCAFHRCSSHESYCSGLQNVSATEAGGDIVSHASGAHCSWFIRAPAGKIIVAWFTSLDLEESSERNDSVSLFDGVPKPFNLLKVVNKLQHTGFIWPPRSWPEPPISPRFVSSSNLMTVKFQSGNGSTERKGFRLHFELSHSPNDSACGSISWFSNDTENSGELVSHREYNGLVPYARSMSCRWDLPSAGSTVAVVTVLNLSLSQYDSLYIMGAIPSKYRTNLYYQEKTWAAVSNAELQPRSKILILFKSTGRHRHRSTGFRLKIVYYRSHIISHKVGEFNGSNATRSIWFIEAAAGNGVQLQLTYCGLRRGDSIKVYDERITKTIARINGTNCKKFLEMFESRSNFVRVTFDRGDRSTNRRFSVKYDTTQEIKYCFGYVIKEASSDIGEISSHREAGLTNYLNHMRCFWELNANINEIVVAWFSHMDLQNNSGDFIRMYDGWHVNKEHLIVNISLEGHAGWISPIFATTYPRMVAFFETDAAVTRTGFRLQWKTRRPLTSNRCGSVVWSDASNSSGELASHEGYDGFTPHPGNLSCLTYLPGLSYSRGLVYVTLVSASLAEGDCLHVTSSGIVSGEPIHLCGWVAVKNLTLVGPVNIVVRYRSYSKYKSAGFLIRFHSRMDDTTRTPEATTRTPEATACPSTPFKPNILHRLLNSCVSSLESCSKILSSCSSRLESCVKSTSWDSNGN